jgi:hypothetical protein
VIRLCDTSGCVFTVLFCPSELLSQAGIIISVLCLAVLSRLLQHECFLHCTELLWPKLESSKVLRLAVSSAWLGVFSVFYLCAPHPHFDSSDSTAQRLPPRRIDLSFLEKISYRWQPQRSGTGPVDPAWTGRGRIAFSLHHKWLHLPLPSTMCHSHHECGRKGPGDILRV